MTPIDSRNRCVVVVVVVVVVVAVVVVVVVVVVVDVVTAATAAFVVVVVVVALCGSCGCDSSGNSLVVVRARAERLFCITRVVVITALGSGRCCDVCHSGVVVVFVSGCLCIRVRVRVYIERHMESGSSA